MLSFAVVDVIEFPVVFHRGSFLESDVMQVDALMKLLDILGPYRSKERTISVRDIALKWDAQYPDGVPNAATVRTIQRYVNQLAMPTADFPALLGVDCLDISVSVRKASSKRTGSVINKEVNHYYLPPDNLVKWFMTEPVALQLMITGQVVGQSLGAIKQLSTKDAEMLANQVLSKDKAAELGKIAACVRIVPDGLGRLRTLIQPKVIQKIIDAIVANKAVAIEYKTPTGQDGKRIVNPLGLVGKDGTVYLVASKGFDPVIIHYALQRATDAEVATKYARHVPAGFDLDQHINETHLLSHSIGPDIELVLEVHDDALHHFIERPLTGTQKITKSKKPKWRRVTATIPDTVLLIPFLSSQLEHVQVISPKHLRDDMTTHLQKMMMHYL
jgi:predicted DNA-binding transcriptional regulator YafY